MDYLEHLFISQTLERLSNASRHYGQSLAQLKQVMKGASQFNPKLLEERERVTKEKEKIDHDINLLMPIVRESGFEIIDELSKKFESLKGLQFLKRPDPEKEEIKIIMSQSFGGQKAEA